MDRVDAKLLTSAMGFDLDRWQVQMIQKFLADDIDSMAVPRQNGKTEVDNGCMAVFGLAGFSSLYTAHDTSQVKNNMRRMFAICRSDAMKPYVKKCYVGDRLVEFNNGATIGFSVRSPDAGVGLTVDLLVVDEAQKMDDIELEAISPLMTTSENRRELWTGTPPTDADIARAAVIPFRTRRKKRERFVDYGAGDYSEDMPTTLALAKKTNPAWKRIPDFKGLVERERRSMSHAAFCRQRLGAWPPIEKTVVVPDPELSAQEVEAVMTKTGSTANVFDMAIGIWDQVDTAFVVAFDGKFLELIHTADLTHGLPELAQWLVNRGRMIRTLTIKKSWKGSALAEILMASPGLARKVRVPNPVMAGTKYNVFAEKVRARQVMVFDNWRMREALGSFWFETSKTGNTILKNTTGETELAVQALALALTPTALMTRAAPALVF
jgi:hypothetical protein